MGKTRRPVADGIDHKQLDRRNASGVPTHGHVTMTQATVRETEGLATRFPLDQFALARMEGNQLQPTADASPAVLIRRLAYDLTGLPRWSSRGPFGMASNELPPARIGRRQSKNWSIVCWHQHAHFGERWRACRLDIARYGQARLRARRSRQDPRNASFPHAWRYRDYVD